MGENKTDEEIQRQRGLGTAGGRLKVGEEEKSFLLADLGASLTHWLRGVGSQNHLPCAVASSVTRKKVGDTQLEASQSRAPTVRPQHPKSMFNSGLSPGMFYRDMQLRGLGYSPSTGKGSVAGDKKVAPGRVVCVLNYRLPAHSQGWLTRPPLLGSGSQPITSQIGAAVLTKQEKHTPGSYRCRYPVLIRQREGSLQS